MEQIAYRLDALADDKSAGMTDLGRPVSIKIVYERRPLLLVVCSISFEWHRAFQEPAEWLRAVCESDAGNVPPDRWRHASLSLFRDDSAEQLFTTIARASGRTCRMIKDRLPLSTQVPAIFRLDFEPLDADGEDGRVDSIVDVAIQRFIGYVKGIGAEIPGESVSRARGVAIPYCGAGDPLRQAPRRWLDPMVYEWPYSNWVENGGGPPPWWTDAASRWNKRVLIAGSGDSALQDFLTVDAPPRLTAARSPDFWEKVALDDPKWLDEDGSIPTATASISGAHARSVETLKEGLRLTKLPKIIDRVAAWLGAAANEQTVLRAAESFMDRWRERFVQYGRGEGPLPGEDRFVAPLSTRERMTEFAPIYIEAITALKSELAPLIAREAPRWRARIDPDPLPEAPAVQIAREGEGSFYQRRSVRLNFADFFGETPIDEIDPKQLRKFFGHCADRGLGMRSTILFVDAGRREALAEQLLLADFQHGRSDDAFRGYRSDRKGNKQTVVIELKVAQPAAGVAAEAVAA